MKSKPFLRRDRRSGAVLIIVLAFVVLLTGLIIAYLSLSSTEQKLANSSVTGSKADQLAMSALDIITGDLKQEIVNGSIPEVGNFGSTTNYIPTGNANMVPRLSGIAALTNTVPDPLPNLVRISMYNDATGVPSSAAPLVGSRASNLASTLPSANGKSISLKRWNRHYLLPRSSPGSAAFDSTPTSTFVAPDWVFVNNHGPQVITTPSTSVFGRYAYAIYDEGGTLDLNVAGYPTASPLAQTGAKGAIAYADLTMLTNAVPTVSSAQMNNVINSVVGWRNYASAQPSGSFSSGFSFNASSIANYFNTVSTNGASGFMNVAPASTSNGNTDQAFLNRQQLIDFWTTQNFAPDLLQYVGTFSREANAPSWSPSYNASTLGGTGAYAYKANADSVPAPTNPDFLNVRLSGFSGTATLTYYALNGTLQTVQVRSGSPVVRRRFCLGRLAWLTYQGPNPAIPNAAAAIKQHFGLVWGTDSAGTPAWIYTSPDGAGTTPATSIKTLSQVAALAIPREPDFFELLQAGILSGSLGRDAGIMGGASTGGPAGDTYNWDTTPAYQVLQIGANIIDQYSTDNYPTEIEANFPTAAGSITPAPSVYGIKNLPYLDRVYFLVFRYASNPNNAGAAFLPEIWNPHQSPAVSPTAGPTQFRFTASGIAYARVSPLAYVQPLVPVQPPVTVLNSPTVTWNGANDPSIQFSKNPSEPYLLQGSDITTSVPAKNLFTTATITHNQYYAGQGATTWSTLYLNQTDQGRSLAGLWVGDITSPAAPNDVSLNYYFEQGQIIPSGVTFYLQYLAPDGTWRTYSQMKKVSNSIVGSSVSDIMNPYQNDNQFYVGKPDPRTDRFSVSGNYQGYGGTAGFPNVTMWKNWSTRPELYPNWTPLATSGFFNGGTAAARDNNQYAPGMLSENGSNALTGGGPNVYYADPDGVVRRAAGAYGVSSATDGMPLFTGNTASRPVILNRPFHDVGELGYAFRDLPWKNVDFFTPESGDAALLDLFSVDDGDVVAGRVSLSTRQPVVLEAILNGANKIEENPTPLAATDAVTLATAITNAASTSPFLNRAELVSRFKSSQDTDPRFASYPALSLSSATDNRIKSQRESVVRALGDATTTQTWNLMIDVIAQTGHYPPGATQLSQFSVDGERRYWLHIAIDRFTGEVVDRVWEPVYE
jgi:hypothetical protein